MNPFAFIKSCEFTGLINSNTNADAITMGSKHFSFNIISLALAFLCFFKPFIFFIVISIKVISDVLLCYQALRVTLVVYVISWICVLPGNDLPHPLFRFPANVTCYMTWAVTNFSLHSIWTPEDSLHQMWRIWRRVCMPAFHRHAKQWRYLSILLPKNPLLHFDSTSRDVRATCAWISYWLSLPQMDGLWPSSGPSAMYRVRYLNKWCSFLCFNGPLRPQDTLEWASEDAEAVSMFTHFTMVTKRRGFNRWMNPWRGAIKLRREGGWITLNPAKRLDTQKAMDFPLKNG